MEWWNYRHYTRTQLLAGLGSCSRSNIIGGMNLEEGRKEEGKGSSSWSRCRLQCMIG
jgi:hypothetical protein